MLVDAGQMLTKGTAHEPARVRRDTSIDATSSRLEADIVGRGPREMVAAHPAGVSPGGGPNEMEVQAAAALGPAVLESHNGPATELVAMEAARAKEEWVKA